MARKTSSGMPQINAAFSGWFSRITLLKNIDEVNNGIVTKKKIPISFYGTIQPLSAREISLKPEGQRSWTWLQIHCKAQATLLIPGDQITYSGDIFKVMGLKDYSLNGYVEYHLARDYQTGGSQ